MTSITCRALVCLLCSGLVALATLVLLKSSGGNNLPVSEVISAMDLKPNKWFNWRVGGTQDVRNIALYRLLRRQRDELASAMNALSQEYHQYQCIVGTDDQISSRGGWCTGGSNHVTDAALAAALEKLFLGDAVASFGDGDGGYKKLIDESGKIQVYDSFDGAPFCQNMTGGLVKYLDLSIPVFGLRLYDWIISLEVGEHIPKAYEQIFLDNLVRHARKGIVLSWAVPDQGGHGHVNCQPLEYIVKQLDQRDFYQDKNSSFTIQEASTLSWLKRNAYVYRRKTGHTASALMV